LNVWEGQSELLAIDPNATALSANPLTVLIDTLQCDRLADIARVTRVNADVAVCSTAHVAVGNDRSAIKKLIPKTDLSAAIDESESGLLKLEPLIANSTDSATVGHCFNGLDLTGPSDAPTSGMDGESTVSTGPQSLVKQTPTGLVDVLVDAGIIGADPDNPSDQRLDISNDQLHLV
jgi:hypothetical protein